MSLRATAGSEAISQFDEEIASGSALATTFNESPSPW